MPKRAKGKKKGKFGKIHVYPIFGLGEVQLELGGRERRLTNQGVGGREREREGQRAFVRYAGLGLW